MADDSYGCSKACSDKEVCYADSNNPNISELTFYNFDLSYLNPVSTTVISILGTFIFIALSVYPIEFWRKTPYMFGNILGVYLFFNLALCPCESNSFKSLISP
jgi:hypothetical protein